MGYFDELLARAKGWVQDNQREERGKHDAVPHDTYDARLYERLLAEVPAFEDMHNAFEQKFNYMDDLMRDLLMLFWKGVPKVRAPGEMATPYLLNREASDFILASPEHPDNHRVSKHDRYSSVMSTMGVSEEVREFLENHPELEDMQKEQEQQEGGLDSACGGLMGALGAFQNAFGDGDGEPYMGEGPMTEAQAQAAEEQNAENLEQLAQKLAEMVAKALADAEKQEQLCGDLRTEFEQALGEKANELDQKVRAALAEVTDKMNEEREQFHMWGVEPGDPTLQDFDERKALAKLLNQHKMNKFRKLFGRFKFVMAARRANRTEFGRDEVVDTEFSDDPSRFLATEWAMSKGNRLLRLDFMRRFAEGEILSRKFVGVEHVGQGAIICVVDTSSSMSGMDKGGITREAWAKAFMLALMDQAKASGRDFVAILFASAHQQKMWEFKGGRGPLRDVIECVSFMFNGGTNFENPMTMATDVLERQYNADGTMKGDIVFITDDDCAVSSTWMRKFIERKDKLGFRVFGIQVGAKVRANGPLSKISDDVRSVLEFAQPDEAVGDIFQMIG